MQQQSTLSIFMSAALANDEANAGGVRQQTNASGLKISDSNVKSATGGLEFNIYQT
jgi:hypothetical protein